MTKDDLAVQGAHVHFELDRDLKIVSATFVARVGVKAPSSIPEEHRAAVESKRVENVEVRISKASKVLDQALPTLKGLALDEALKRLAPASAPAGSDGVVV